MEIFGMGQFLTHIILCAYLAGAVAFGEELPPLGQRKYVLDNNTENKPTRIMRVGVPTAKPYLRDPILPGAGLLKKQVTAETSKKPAKKPVTTKASQIQFSTMKIGGRLTKPRVEFTVTNPVLSRADEPNQIDFLERLTKTVEESERGL